MGIGVELGGEHGAISATAVRDSLDDLIALVSDASETGAATWVIADLRIGSAAMAVASPTESEALQVLRAGLETLAHRAQIPAGWTRRMVARIARLGERAGRGGVTAVDLTLGTPDYKVAITAGVVDHANRALGTSTVSYGSCRGNVDRWNEHGRGRREVGLATLDGESVVASYPPQLAERIVREAVGRQIEAWGTVHRNPSGQLVKIEMDDFATLEQAPSIPIREMVGVFVRDDGEPMLVLDEWMAARGD